MAIMPDGPVLYVFIMLVVEPPFTSVEAKAFWWHGVERPWLRVSKVMSALTIGMSSVG